MINALILLLGLLLIKHFVVDFYCQTEYQWKNKGNFKHPGGYLHAFLHVSGSFFVYEIIAGLTGLFPEWWLVWFLLAVEGVTHYLTDYTKVNICKKYGWAPTTSPLFWWATGTDQLIHVLVLLFTGWFYIQNV